MKAKADPESQGKWAVDRTGSKETAGGKVFRLPLVGKKGNYTTGASSQYLRKGHMPMTPASARAGKAMPPTQREVHRGRGRTGGGEEGN